LLFYNGVKRPGDRQRRRAYTGPNFAEVGTIYFEPLFASLAQGHDRRPATLIVRRSRLSVRGRVAGGERAFGAYLVQNLFVERNVLRNYLVRTVPLDRLFTSLFAERAAEVFIL
jgi:hypothetical protein